MLGFLTQHPLDPTTQRLLHMSPKTRVHREHPSATHQDPQAGQDVQHGPMPRGVPFLNERRNDFYWRGAPDGSPLGTAPSPTPTIGAVCTRLPAAIEKTIDVLLLQVREGPKHSETSVRLLVVKTLDVGRGELGHQVAEEVHRRQTTTVQS